jgi:uncharacterized membrane protein
MSDRPVFIYAATYADRDAAIDDYQVLLDLHAAKLVGTYDVAVISKDEEGKVHVYKHEKPTQHGAWGGIAVGALLGVIFPPSIIGTAAVGGLVGGVGAHLRKGMKRGDAKDLGEMLDEGQAALIVIGESRVAEQIDEELKRKLRSTEKELEADVDALRSDLEQAQREGAMP